jgi:hypothetical protein
LGDNDLFYRQLPYQKIQDDNVVLCESEEESGLCSPEELRSWEKDYALIHARKNVARDVLVDGDETRCSEITVNTMIW